MKQYPFSRLWHIKGLDIKLEKRFKETCEPFLFDAKYIFLWNRQEDKKNVFKIFDLITNEFIFELPNIDQRLYLYKVKPLNARYCFLLMKKEYQELFFRSTIVETNILFDMQTKEKVDLNNFFSTEIKNIRQMNETTFMIVGLSDGQIYQQFLDLENKSATGNPDINKFEELMLQW
jgi:hypothetical protein